jgi:hypothetical protein
MHLFARRSRAAYACAILLGIPPSFPQAANFPTPETLSYSIEWRLIYAGSARLHLAPQTSAGRPEWQSQLHLESGGLVSKLYKLDDNYLVQMEDQFCATSSDLNATEGKRRRETKVSFDRKARKANYVERDLIKKSEEHAETEIPACVSDIIGGLYKLRSLKLEPGQNTQIPLSDGKKSVLARVEAQEREEIKTKLGVFKTVRYEAFVFNGVLYKKNARLLIWLTDDSRRLPVQVRARMPFPIGSITLQLDKEERT